MVKQAALVCFIPAQFWTPFAVSIKIESVDDAIKIYSLFNSPSVTKSFEIPDEVHIDIRNHILRKCPRAGYYKHFFEKAENKLSAKNR